jgi:hypothetical protein
MQAHGHIASKLLPISHRATRGSDPNGFAHDAQIIHGLTHQTLHNSMATPRAVGVGEIGERIWPAKDFPHELNPPK